MAIKSVTSLTRSGVSDWIWQRLSAVVLAGYSIFLLCIFICGDVTYDYWKSLFHQPIVIVATILALLSLAAHGWIGVWTISTDYLTERQMGSNGTLLRWIFQGISAVILFGSVIWAALVLWGAA